MSLPLPEADLAAVRGIVSALESAWNAGDGSAYAALMALDADFVTIRAEHFQGRAAIAAGHEAIFRTIYAGSVNHYSIESVRLLAPNIGLVHVHAVLEAPSGPLAGRHEARFSAVLERREAGWEIAAFHNTLAPPPRP